MGSDEHTDRLTGTMIGKFRVLRKLGEGGMGSVYLAERVGDFEQRVALKLVLEGLTNSETQLRFQTEQQALAALQHPNIVQMVDAGVSDDALPYLAMDYVDGEALDVYCDRLRLSVRERIEIFLQVLDAVDFAHRHFLVHCDLKFSNILVEKNGTVKLLDFGVSKMLQPDFYGMTEAATKATLRPFTPQFASPEQLTLSALSTATDVYAAGVLLYMLLAEDHPFEEIRDEPVKLLRAICESDPQSPSQRVRSAGRQNAEATEALAKARSTTSTELASTLAGDLDAIVGKAMRKDPAERYLSAALFAQDLRAFLDQKPVAARPQSLHYRASKLVARHRGSITVAALVGLVVIAASGAWLWQSWRADLSRQRAEARFRDVRQLTNTLLFDFYDAVTKLPGATPVQESLVRWSLSYLEELSKQKSTDTTLLLDLAESYRKLGNIQGNPYQNNLGQPKEGVETISRGLELLSPALAAEPDDRDVQLAASGLYAARSQIRWLMGAGELCLDDARMAVKLLDPLAEKYPENYDIQMTTATRHEFLADLQGGPYSVEMNMDQAFKNLELAKRYASQAASADPSHVRPKRAQVIFQMKIADMVALDDPKEALKLYNEALTIFDAIPEEGKQEYASQRARTALLRSTGWSMTAMGDYRGALERYRELLPAYEKAVEEDPTNEQTAFDLAVILHEIGETQHFSGDFAGCASTFARMAKIVDSIATGGEAKERVIASAEALVYKGMCLDGIGESSLARQAAAQGLAVLARESAPEDVADSVLVRAADFFLIAKPKDLRDPAKALRLVERRYTEGIAEDSYYLMLRADALAQLGRKQEALEVVEKAIKNTKPEVNINTWNRLQEIKGSI